MDFSNDDFFKKTIYYNGRAIRMTMCFYCGSVDDMGRDHIIPHAYAGTSKRTFIKGEIVPCCNECNATKGSNILDSVEDIARFLSGKFVRKYRKVLKMPMWTAEDLEDMSENFIREISASVSLKQETHDRLDHLEMVANGYHSCISIDALDPRLTSKGKVILDLIADIKKGYDLVSLIILHPHIDYRLIGRVRNKSVCRDMWEYAQQYD